MKHSYLIILTLTALVIAVRPCAADSELIFPQIADGGGYRTSLLLSNPTSAATSATIAFFRSSGAPWTLTVGNSTASAFTVTLPARGSAKLQTSGSAPAISAGWARVTASPAAAFNGNAVFQLYSGSSLFSEASVAASRPMTSAGFSLDEVDGFQTAFAIANSGATTAVGTLAVRSSAGDVQATQSILLSPGQQTATFLRQLVDLRGITSGQVEISLTEGSLSMTALRFHDSSVFSAVPIASFASTAALFSPQGGVRARIVSEIDQSRRSIDIAIYSFTSNDIRNALVSARNRGIVIRIIADFEQATTLGGEVPTLQQMGFNLKLSQGGNPNGIMHNKYMIVDGALLVTGSYNWTARAENDSYENAIFLRDADAIRSYIADFDKIWAATP